MANHNPVLGGASLVVGHGSMAQSAIDIDILLKNQDFLAVHKPSGISVHNNEDPQNLLRVLSEQLKVKALYPVHRLDKETSGIQVLALNSTSAQTLAKEFEQRSVVKIYRGVLRGRMKAPSGFWQKSLTDKAEGRKNPEGVKRDRVPCETHYRVLQESPYFSLCEFDLKTGRQHQIRKHAALDNHAIVGDPRYGDPKYNAKMAMLYKTERMFLHCARLEILGNVIECLQPEIFAQLLQPI